MNWSLLRTFIDNKAEFSEEEFSELKQCLVIKQFKKNEIVLHQGEVCNFVGFINKGGVSYTFRVKAPRKRCNLLYY